jgi:hypothetical protein
LEYCYFSPPSGRRFDSDHFRHNLSGAIIGMNDSNASLAFFFEDFKSSMDGYRASGAGGKAVELNGALSIYSMVQIDSVPAFKLLANLWGDNTARIVISGVFQKVFSGLNEFFSSEDNHDAARKHYDAWMMLANHSWDAPNEKSLAEWLKKQPGLVEPPPSEYTDDPTNPFLPLRPSD